MRASLLAAIGAAGLVVAPSFAHHPEEVMGSKEFMLCNADGHAAG